MKESTKITWSKEWNKQVQAEYDSLFSKEDIPTQPMRYDRYTKENPLSEDITTSFRWMSGKEAGDRTRYRYIKYSDEDSVIAILPFDDDVFEALMNLCKTFNYHSIDDKNDAFSFSFTTDFADVFRIPEKYRPILQKERSEIRIYLSFPNKMMGDSRCYFMANDTYGYILLEYPSVATWGSTPLFEEFRAWKALGGTFLGRNVVRFPFMYNNNQDDMHSNVVFCPIQTDYGLAFYVTIKEFETSYQNIIITRDKTMKTEFGYTFHNVGNDPTQHILEDTKIYLNGDTDVSFSIEDLLHTQYTTTKPLVQMIPVGDDFLKIETELTYQIHNIYTKKEHHQCITKDASPIRSITDLCSYVTLEHVGRNTGRDDQDIHVTIDIHYAGKTRKLQMLHEYFIIVDAFGRTNMTVRTERKNMGGKIYKLLYLGTNDVLLGVVDVADQTFFSIYDVEWCDRFDAKPMLIGMTPTIDTDIIGFFTSVMNNTTGKNAFMSLPHQKYSIVPFSKGRILYRVHSDMLYFWDEYHEEFRSFLIQNGILDRFFDRDISLYAQMIDDNRNAILWIKEEPMYGVMFCNDRYYRTDFHRVLHHVIQEKQTFLNTGQYQQVVYLSLDTAGIHHELSNQFCLDTYVAIGVLGVGAEDPTGYRILRTYLWREGIPFLFQITPERLFDMVRRKQLVARGKDGLEPTEESCEKYVLYYEDTYRWYEEAVKRRFTKRREIDHDIFTTFPMQGSQVGFCDIMWTKHNDIGIYLLRYHKVLPEEEMEYDSRMIVSEDSSYLYIPRNDLSDTRFRTHHEIHYTLLPKHEPLRIRFDQEEQKVVVQNADSKVELVVKDGRFVYDEELVCDMTRMLYGIAKKR